MTRGSRERRESGMPSEWCCVLRTDARTESRSVGDLSGNLAAVVTSNCVGSGKAPVRTQCPVGDRRDSFGTGETDQDLETCAARREGRSATAVADLGQCAALRCPALARRCARALRRPARLRDERATVGAARGRAGTRRRRLRRLHLRAAPGPELAGIRPRAPRRPERREGRGRSRRPPGLPAAAARRCSTPSSDTARRRSATCWRRSRRENAPLRSASGASVALGL